MMKYQYTKYKLELIKENIFNGCDYQVANSNGIHKFLTDIYGLHKKTLETFIAIAINAIGNIIGYFTISIGDLCSSHVHPHEIFKFLICYNAGFVISSHTIIQAKTLRQVMRISKPQNG